MAEFWTLGIKSHDMRKTAQEMVGNPNSHEIFDWIETATIDELREFLRVIPVHSSLATRARDALGIKLAALTPEPHWTVTPGFIVALLAMIFAAIAAWPVIRSWFRP